MFRLPWWRLARWPACGSESHSAAFDAFRHRRVRQAAETLGYESAWVAEGTAAIKFAVLGAVCRATRRIRLGTSISSVFVRSAPTIGMAAATVDQLADGRFILGLGAATAYRSSPSMGIPFVQPTARLRDTIAIVRALVQNGPRLVSRRNHHDRAVRSLVPTAAAPDPDLRCRAVPSDAGDRGRAGGRVLLTWPTPGTIARAVEHVALARVGRPRAATAIDVASLIPCAVAKTAAAARDALRPASALRRLLSAYNRLLAEGGLRATRARHSRRRLTAAAATRQRRRCRMSSSTRRSCGQHPRRVASAIDAYRRAGLALPIVSPRASGADALAMAMAAIARVRPERAGCGGSHTRAPLPSSCSLRRLYRAARVRR